MTIAEEVLSTEAVSTDSATTIVSTLRIDRIAGLSSERLRIDLTVATEKHDELLAIDSRLEAISETISDDLYTLVPLLEDDKQLRRITLAVRRATRENDISGLSDESLDGVHAALAVRLGSDHAGRFSDWRTMLRHRLATYQAFHEAYVEGVSSASRILAEVVTDRELGLGIAQANVEFGRSLHSISGVPRDRETRTLVSYSARAAFKPSPFSTLTSVGVPGNREGPGVWTSIAQTHIMAWFDAIARDEDLIRAFELEPLSTGGIEPLHDLVAVPTTTNNGKFAWRHDQVVDLQGYGPLLKQLEVVGRAPADRYLKLIAGEDPFAALLRFIELGILRVVAPWTYAEPDKLGALARAVEALGTDRACKTSELLRTMIIDVASADLSEGPQRAIEHHDIGARAENELAERDIDPTSRVFQVYSDFAPTMETPRTPSSVVKSLERIGDHLRPLVFRSRMYDVIVQTFVERFGAGGRVNQPWSYFVSMAGSARIQSALMDAARLDALPNANHGRQNLEVGLSSSRPASTVFYQIAAQDFDSLSSGEFKIIVNRFGSGMGGLIARFAHLHPGEGGVREGLRSWGAALHPEARIVEFVSSSDVNTMQASSAGTFPRLIWPTESPLSPGTLDGLRWDDLSLHHDQASNGLIFMDRQGVAVAPVYLGLVPGHLLQGVDRLVSIISDPWVVHYADSCAKSLFAPRQPFGEQTEFAPRIEIDNVVTQRARWRVSIEQLPQRGQKESAEEFFLRLNTWRRVEGIDSQVFLVAERKSIDLRASKRKPVWFSFASAHSIAQVFAMLDDSVLGIELTEILPGTDEQWLRDDTGNRRAAEHLSMLRWEQ